MLFLASGAPKSGHETGIELVDSPRHIREHARYCVYLEYQIQSGFQAETHRKPQSLTISAVAFFGRKPSAVRIAFCSGVSFDDVAHFTTK